MINKTVRCRYKEALKSRVLVTKQSHSRYLNSQKEKGNETSGKQNTENIDATNHAVLPPVVVIPCIPYLSSRPIPVLTSSPSTSPCILNKQ